MLLSAYGSTSTKPTERYKPCAGASARRLSGRTLAEPRSLASCGGREPHLRRTKAPCFLQQPLDQRPAGTDAAHVRLDVHPLDLSHVRRQALEAAYADVAAVVPDELKGAGGRKELRTVFDVGARHRLDVEGQSITGARDLADPAEILDEQHTGCLALARSLNGHQIRRHSQ